MFELSTEFILIGLAVMLAVIVCLFVGDDRRFSFPDVIAYLMGKIVSIFNRRDR